MKKPKAKVNDIVRIVFLDHAAIDFSDENTADGHVLEFEVIGRIVEESTVHYTIANWLYLKHPLDENCEGYGIVKGAIKSIEILIDRECLYDSIDL